MLLQQNEQKLTQEFRKTIEAICFKNFTDKKFRTEDEILSQYNFLEVLGTGYFSKVYLVSDHEGRLFALKVIKKKLFLTKESIQKILVEKAILRALNHENILKLYKTI